MFARIIIILALFGFSPLLRAVGEKMEALTVGAETYKNVTVTAVTATDLYFKHSRGMTNVKLKSLDAELQKKFGFDAKKAANETQQQRQGATQYAQEVAKAKPNRPPPAPAAEPEQVEKAAPPAGPSGPLINRPAPELVVEKWLTDQPNTQGKFVIIDFWATWCGPCRRSIPELNTWYRQFNDKLAIIGLSDETEAEVRRMTVPKIEYAIAIDTKSRLSNVVGVRSIPHILLIDPKGIVRYVGHPGNLDEVRLKDLFTRFGD